MTTEIVIPTSLSEIPLMNYQKFIKLVEGSNDEELIAQKSIEIFCGLNMQDVLKIKWSDVVGLANHFNELFQQKTEFKTTFKIKDIEFGFIPNLEDMSFGEYVDLDHNIGKVESFHKAMAVLYRPITKKTKDTYSIMGYSGTDEFAELMKYAPLDIAMAASVFFLSFRKRLSSSYAYLFGAGDDEEQGATNDYSERAQFNKQWGWYNSIYALAKGDVTKFDEVTKLGIRKCLTYLTYERQRTEIENNELKRKIRHG